MSKFKINLFCNDSLLPSTSDKNVSKYTEWVKDGSGEINLYVNQKCLDVFSDTSTKRRYIWLLESRQIIPNIFDFVEKNHEFLLTRCDGIFTCDKELCKIPGFKYVISNAAPWVEDRKIFDKTKLVSMISSNKSYTEGHKKRLEYVNQFKDMVDLYGRGIKDIACKEDGLRDYMFSISIENAVYDTYFTEKLTDCFSTGTIPIFYGSDKVVEYFNEDGIIFLDENFNISILTEELYNSKKDAIVDNFERSINLPIAEDYMFENYFQ
jgi:hypothetical protein